MTPLEIKIELLQLGISQADIARQCGCSRTHIHRVIANPGAGAESIRRVIAINLGRHVTDVWPYFYASSKAGFHRSTLGQRNK